MYYNKNRRFFNARSKNISLRGPTLWFGALAGLLVEINRFSQMR
nr:photosystem I subunit J [Lathraea japonica]